MDSLERALQELKTYIAEHGQVEGAVSWQMAEAALEEVCLNIAALQENIQREDAHAEAKSGSSN